MKSQVGGGLVRLEPEVVPREADDVGGSSGASVAPGGPRETAAGHLVTGIRSSSEDDSGGDLHTDPEESDAHKGNSEEDDRRIYVSRRRGAQGAAATPVSRLDSSCVFKGARAHSNAVTRRSSLASG